MTYQCRYVDYNDIQQANTLVELLNAYATDPAGGGEPLTENVTNNLVSELKKRSFAHSFIVYDNETPIGLANCFEAFSSFACAPILNIHDFAVIPQYRGRGVAAVLLQAIQAFAEKQGMIKITLEVLSNNEPAKSTYKRFGFEPYSLEEGYGIAEFWQKKLLVKA